MLFRTLIIFLSLSFFGCSVFSPKRGPRRKTPTLDVPHYARGAKGGVKKRILVLPFLDEKLTRSSKIRNIARRALVHQIISTGQFVVVKNSDFPQDLKKFLNQKNEYNFERISKITAGMGISGLVEGKILEIRAKKIGDQVGLIRQIKAQVEAVIKLRMASAKNGKILLDEVKRSKVETTTTRVAKYSYSDRYLEQDPVLVKKAVIKAMNSSVGLIVRSVQKISWEGRVAMVTGDKIYVNAGRLSGLQVGDILKITEKGPEIFDPETGIFIGNAPGRMKGTLELVSYFGKDGSIGIVHSGSGFRENDRVELY